MADDTAMTHAPGAASKREAAPGVEQLDVKAVNTAEDRQLYASRQKVYPKLAHGKFRNIKWAVMAVTLGIYYLLPWMRWDRGPNLPDQAFLIDFANQRIYMFWLDIWAQELYFITGILVVSALALFLVTAYAGRVWCGYACPQTVWTDLMIAVERFWQGDRNARMRLDKKPWTLDKIWRKTATHASWLLIALATGGAFVFYFRDAPTLAVELVNGTAPAIAYIFLGIFTGTTYLLGGIAREQVCIYMCPWPRIQGAMFDSDSLLVTYREHRGEPRGPHKKGESWEGRGDCIDCYQCVAVCPTGIDIRNGPQLECIQCALCIDACNEVMDKVGRPRGLIAYDTFRNLEAQQHGETAPPRLIRPRTVLYASLIVVVLAVMGVGLMNKTVLETNVLRDRNPLFIQLSDGDVRNRYTVKILNKRYEPRTFQVAAQGLPGAQIEIVGFEGMQSPDIEVPASDLRELQVHVTVPAEKLGDLEGASTPFQFVINDTQAETSNSVTTTFRRPE
ncbi:cytochrome c oxidase accessory protein CcoG [Dichotomicrobium thermohalophilum]|uniref:Cytochrome c oxidase accessory protein FixG n=1 Tax=Dichotomicrobium thermohalophilum TaxID=933063 RepID=A0A397PKX4_9HYPH|nr:cytochrome c oxidase accessory protein CcoG [Dichotomicrobium thermohalophilum]RIA47807.1 cytochrome c oxidase accessory protein FixG [Dichotomicrobium thermohalophilum]